VNERLSTLLLDLISMDLHKKRLFRNPSREKKLKPKLQNLPENGKQNTPLMGVQQ